MSQRHSVRVDGRDGASGAVRGPLGRAPSAPAAALNPTAAAVALVTDPGGGRWPGRPLDGGTRAYFEPKMGVDFGAVRVHEGNRAARAAAGLGARAFTVGSDIVLGEPASRDLLGHELSHVAGQQRSGRPTVQLASVSEPVATSYDWVYLASGHDLTPTVAEQVKQETREVFARHGRPLSEEWMISSSEDAMPTLLLDWQPEWGGAPSLWMNPATLEAHFAGQRAPYELADTPFDSEELEASFTEEEIRWIDEVMAMREIALLMSAFGEIPPVVLHRVKKTKTGAAGKTRGEHVAIAETRRTEETFKGTLIHELLHFVEGQTAHLSREMITPKKVVGYLVWPERAGIGFAPYDFGWFVHPGSGALLHFDWPLLNSSPLTTIVGHPELQAVAAAGNYEASPKIQTGSGPDPEEDLATSVSHYLLDGQWFQRAYPRRHLLLQRYFDEYLPGLAAQPK